MKFSLQLVYGRNSTPEQSGRTQVEGRNCSPPPPWKIMDGVSISFYSSRNFSHCRGIDDAAVGIREFQPLAYVTRIARPSFGSSICRRIEEASSMMDSVKRVRRGHSLTPRPLPPVSWAIYLPNVPPGGSCWNVRNSFLCSSALFTFLFLSKMYNFLPRGDHRDPSALPAPSKSRAFLGDLQTK